MQRKKLKIASIILIAVMSIMLVYATLKYTETITNQANILGYELKLWRNDTAQIVTSINWDGCEKGTTKTTEEVFAFLGELYIKNTGDYMAHSAWQLDPTTELPAGVTLICEAHIIDGAWFEWAQNNYQETWAKIPAGDLIDYPIRFLLTIDANAERGEFSFNILLHAADTTAG